MNRNEEYYALLGELSAAEAPSASLKKAVRRNRTIKFIVRPLAAVAAVLAAFTVIVNASTTAAFAMSKVPGLKELAKAVTFSRSLKDAVDHEYAQLVDLEKSSSGITANVEYLIVDRQQLVVFYRLSSKDHANIGTDCDFYTAGGERSGSSWGPNPYELGTGSMPENGSLRSVYVEHFDTEVPPELKMVLRFWDADDGHPAAGESEYICEMDFDLSFDPQYRSSGKRIEIGKTVNIGSRSVNVRALDIYPIRTVLQVEGASSNDAWLTGLEFTIKTPDGRSFGSESSGTIAYSSDVSVPEIQSYTAGSLYFSGARSATLEISGAKWLDKDMEKVRIDLKNASASALPSGCGLEDARLETRADGTSVWVVTFLEKDSLGQLLMPAVFDAEGKECVRELSWTPAQNKYLDRTAPEGFSYTTYYLSGCSSDTVYMQLCATEVWSGDIEPSRISLDLD